MRWFVDGYNVIRRSPELHSVEGRGLDAAREALLGWLSAAAQTSGDRFIAVFDGAGAGGHGLPRAGVEVLFSSARESADQVLARRVRAGDTLVSSDREVRQAAAQAGATAVSADQFLAAFERMARRAGGELEPAVDAGDGGEVDDSRRGTRKKGNPRRRSKKDRAVNRALGRLRPPRP
jgi:predicted RNA-binding protein with PIN domain